MCDVQQWCKNIVIAFHFTALVLKLKSKPNFCMNTIHIFDRFGNIEAQKDKHS